MESRCRYGVQKDDVVDEVHRGDKLDTSVAAGCLTREDGSTCMLNIRTLEYSVLSTRYEQEDTAR